MAYKTIPVDEETYNDVKVLCKAYEMGQRGAGALVRKLVKAELKDARAQGLVTDEMISSTGNPDESHPHRRSTDQ